jgi:hypothetical protein
VNYCILPKAFFLLAAILYSGQSNFKFEYLSKFVNEFENILGYESEAQMGLIDEKNQWSNISCYCPFKKAVPRSIRPVKNFVSCSRYQEKRFSSVQSSLCYNLFQFSHRLGLLASYVWYSSYQVRKHLSML